MTTKVPDCGRLGGCADHYKNTTASLEANLQQLGVEYVDLVLVHWPPSTNAGNSTLNCKAVQDDWRAMEDFYAAEYIDKLD